MRNATVLDDLSYCDRHYKPAKNEFWGKAQTGTSRPCLKQTWPQLQRLKSISTVDHAPRNNKTINSYNIIVLLYRFACRKYHCHTGAHFANDFSIVIPIRWKIRINVVGYHNATKFCTWHDSTAVVPCAKFYGDHFTITWVRAEWNFQRIGITMENRWWNGSLFCDWSHGNDQGSHVDCRWKPKWRHQSMPPTMTWLMPCFIASGAFIIKIKQ